MISKGHQSRIAKKNMYVDSTVINNESVSFLKKIMKQCRRDESKKLKLSHHSLQYEWKIDNKKISVEIENIKMLSCMKHKAAT